jgi:hypothetical protein
MYAFGGLPQNLAGQVLYLYSTSSDVEELEVILMMQSDKSPSISKAGPLFFELSSLSNVYP